MKLTVYVLASTLTCVSATIELTDSSPSLNGAPSGTFSPVSPDTTGKLVDRRDGKAYKSVKIGKQTWMAENLNYATKGGSWCYGNDPKNCATFGRLYNWEAAVKACPTGWHLPTDEEWKELEMHLGMKRSQADADRYRGTKEGGKLRATGTREAGTGLWAAPNHLATNESGFTALPAGNLEADSSFLLLGHYSFWWTASENSTRNAWYRFLSFKDSEIIRYPTSKKLGFSVRCLCD